MFVCRNVVFLAFAAVLATACEEPQCSDEANFVQVQLDGPGRKRKKRKGKEADSVPDETTTQDPRLEYGENGGIRVKPGTYGGGGITIGGNSATPGMLQTDGPGRKRKKRKAKEADSVPAETTTQDPRLEYGENGGIRVKPGTYGGGGITIGGNSATPGMLQTDGPGRKRKKRKAKEADSVPDETTTQDPRLEYGENGGIRVKPGTYGGGGITIGGNSATPGML
eukprot:TRINITY_DN789_c0_g1_i1.p1 TRINITY_DN789_c0_g1~~TRINITY_DN789_c0_g1_i1.p1  ORF type:complete len:224 (-),score=44.77 TRINITY_DN789_c0_g1_i1:324-995(-)